MARYGKKAQSKVKRAMHERKEGTLRSGRSGKRVTSRKQAIAIGLSEARKKGAKVPSKRGSSKKGGGTTTTTINSADNQSLSVWTMLQRTNACAVNGVLWAKPVTIGGITYTSAILQAQGKTVFSAIAALGTILQ